MGEGPIKPTSTVSMWTGRVIADSYQIVRCIGEGGMGTVFEAQHVRLPLRFAVKVLKRSSQEQPELLARFRREAELASGLRHRHIVEVIDYNTTEEGEPYLVMEYLEGETLAGRIRRRGRLPLEQAASITREIGLALTAAHRAQVIHRDLKPQNIFLCRKDEREDFVKVMDFGISKLLGTADSLTEENVVLGTPGYASPEAVIGKSSQAGVGVDIFGLGLIMYEMLSGRVAFSGESTESVFRKLVEEDPAPLLSLNPTLPPAIERVVMRAIAKRPQDRYLSAEAFLDELSATMGSEPATAALRTGPPNADPFTATVPSGPPLLASETGPTKPTVPLGPDGSQRPQSSPGEARARDLQRAGRGKLGLLAAGLAGLTVALGTVALLLARSGGADRHAEAESAGRASSPRAAAIDAGRDRGGTVSADRAARADARAGAVAAADARARAAAVAEKRLPKAKAKSGKQPKREPAAKTKPELKDGIVDDFN